MMIGNGWMGRGGVLVSALALSGCGIFFDDGSNGGGDVPPADDPAPAPDEDPRTEEEAFDEECVPQAWIDEARDTAAWGASASFEIDGSQVQVDAQQSVVESVRAPVTVSLGAGASSVVVFPDAMLGDGLEGTVVIAGADFTANAGALVPAAVEHFELDDLAAVVVPAAGTDHGTRPDLGATADPADVAALEASVPVDVAVEALGVTGYDRAYVVTDAGTVELSGAFVVSAPRAYWPAGSTVHAEAVEATFGGEVFIGIEPLAGQFSVRGEPAEALPIAILGRDAHLVVGPTRVATLEPMPVRQALDSYGALVGADMQLRRCMPETLVMWPGETRIVELAVRERSGLTDAAFADFTVEVDGGAAWPARIELDPTMPAVLTTAADAHPGATWAESLRGFFEAWAEVSRAVTEGIVCVFTLGFLCPDSSSSPPEPTPLAPYPAWAEPSSIHAFEVELTAPSTTGTYTITFTATGQNYAATIPVAVTVED